MAGLESEGIYEKIREEFKQKFPEQAPPNLPDSKSPLKVAAYAYLFKSLPFKWAFDRFPDESLKLLFEGYYVDSFGISELQGLEADSMASQVVIFDYKIDGALIVELKTQAEDDRLILAKVKPEATLGETIKMVEKRLQTAKPTLMEWNEALYIPVLNFDILREYSELYGHLINSTNRLFQGSKIVKSKQSIRFQLDEKGAVLKSEGGLYVVVASLPRTYTFDKPFLILLKRRDAENPYFALWVGNAELLVPAQKKPMEDK
jgi:hypothetical protein